MRTVLIALFVAGSAAALAAPAHADAYYCVKKHDTVVLGYDIPHPPLGACIPVP